MDYRYKHVAVIGIDGMGRFNRETQTPFIDKIFSSGAQTYDALSMDPTISAENWGAMLIGASPLVHGLTNSIVGRTEYSNKALPSVFTRIRACMPDAFLASYCNWNPINHGIVEHDVGVELVTADNDSELTEKIIACVHRKPDFLFVQLDDVDGAGHHYGYGQKGHLDKITETDRLVGRIFDAYRDSGIIDDTLFIVTADHGGIRNGHGGYADTEKYVYMALRGRTVVRGQIGPACTKDIAAIVLHAFTIPLPEYNENGFSSQVPEGIFSDYNGEYIWKKPCECRPENTHTPAYDSDVGLKAIFGDEMRLAMFFDDSVTDASGNCVGKQCGAVKYYSMGVRGACGELGSTGYVTYDSIRLSEKSFSISAWLSIDASLDDTLVIVATNDFGSDNRNSKGFSLAMRSNDIVFNIGNGDDHIERIVPFPAEISGGWVHSTVCADKEKAEVSFYYNFKHIHTMKIPQEYSGTWDNYPFTVGNDGRGEYNNVSHNLIFRMDDFFLFDGVLNAEDVKRLGAYYNM